MNRNPTPTEPFSKTRTDPLGQFGQAIALMLVALAVTGIVSG